jgi:hypothetical protein
MHGTHMAPITLRDGDGVSPRRRSFSSPAPRRRHRGPGLSRARVRAFRSLGRPRRAGSSFPAFSRAGRSATPTRWVARRRPSMHPAQAISTSSRASRTSSAIRRRDSSSSRAPRPCLRAFRLPGRAAVPGAAVHPAAPLSAHRPRPRRARRRRTGGSRSRSRGSPSCRGLPCPRARPRRAPGWRRSRRRSPAGSRARSARPPAGRTPDAGCTSWPRSRRRRSRPRRCGASIGCSRSSATSRG